ncbi:unnamed protein product [Phytophthora fragariaefolia]|uniref:Unnamed protein product n=1 Tax=Phytophthora fragariaefolia TaxID=1490495 RepID=A0A9W6UC06_9STRA|nr:unnamed protein product [Phytophthora fragariaefolia]
MIRYCQFMSAVSCGCHTRLTNISGSEWIGFESQLSVSKITEDLQRLVHSFNNKLQADINHQQREQQKSALLFAEVSRLGHRLEGLESELKGIADDTQRKFEAQDQHAQFLASVGSKQPQAASPNRTTEIQRQLRDMQDAMVQFRNEVDADRNARWKNDAAVDAKLEAQLDRINTKMAADKRDLARVLDEQRQLITGADLQRVTAHMREFSRVNDHLLALERWLHGEFNQVKRVFQALAGDVDERFQCVLVEIGNGLKMWHAAQTRQEETVGRRFHDLEEAVRAVALAVQHKIRTLEEVIPLEVQARQKNDDKLRRRVEGVVKALGHAIETSREEYLPLQSTLAHRIHQLELNQHTTSDEISMQHNAMRETIQAFMEDSDAMLVRLAAAVEQERIKGLLSVPTQPTAPESHLGEEVKAETVRIKEELKSLQTWVKAHTGECHEFNQNASTLSPLVVAVPQTHTSDEMKVEAHRVKAELESLRVWMEAHAQECRELLQAKPVMTSVVQRVKSTIPSNSADEWRENGKRVKEEVDALQEWTTMHAQECRQYFDFLSWSMDDIRRESAVVQCLDAVIDQIVETQTCGHFNTLAEGMNGALRRVGAPRLTAKFKAARSPFSRKSPWRSSPTRSLSQSGRSNLLLVAQESSMSTLNEDATDLDLSTTTYYASSDGETAFNGVQANHVPEKGEHHYDNLGEDEYSMDMDMTQEDAEVEKAVRQEENIGEKADESFSRASVGGYVRLHPRDSKTSDEEEPLSLEL